MFEKGFWITRKQNKKTLADKVSLEFFCAFHLVCIQKLKQPMIIIKVWTKNQAYCGFQGWLQTKKCWPAESRAHKLLLDMMHGR